MVKYYLSIGTFNFKDPDNNGIHILNFDQDNMQFRHCYHYNPEVRAGQQYYDSVKKVLYVCDETDGHVNPRTAGGRLYAYKIDSLTGQATLLNYIDTLMTKTCYVWKDARSDYLMVSHHTGRNTVTKMVRNPDGSIGNTILYDDGGVSLIKTNPDGSLDKVVDFITYPEQYVNGGIYHTHCHSVRSDYDGNIFVTCDKGLDMLYTYQIDRANGRILKKSEKIMEKGIAPRYTCFHPFRKIFYENNETSNFICVFGYDYESGHLSELQRINLLENEKSTPSDITVTSDGKKLFVSTRNANRIVSYDIDNDGLLSNRIITDTGESSVRGFCLSPDNSLLFTASPNTNRVEAWKITAEGLLHLTETEVSNAGNITILL